MGTSWFLRQSWGYYFYVQKLILIFNIIENLLHQDGTLKKSLLVSENVYLLHSTEKICLWIGKLAKMEAKKHAMHTAVEYIKKVSL